MHKHKGGKLKLLVISNSCISHPDVTDLSCNAVYFFLFKKKNIENTALNNLPQTSCLLRCQTRMMLQNRPAINGDTGTPSEVSVFRREEEA